MGDPGYGEGVSTPDAAPREPCRFCSGLVRIGARKCPHCREYLDDALAEDRRMQVAEQVNFIVESEALIAKVKNYVGVSAVGSFLLFPLGPLFGAIIVGYGIYYQTRARQMQMSDLPKIRLLFAFAGLWIATGTIFWALVVYWANFR